MNYVIYYKRDVPALGIEECIPILSGTASTFNGLVPISTQEKRKFQLDFPQTIGNLFIHIDGVEFRLDPSASKLD